MNVDSVFYIYEHWRPDTGVCFYVGKGHGDRAYRFRRNNYYNHIAQKLARAGLKIDVRILQSGLDEASALALEVERIAYWRAQGMKLANITSGGEGVSGLRHTQQTRAKIRAKRAMQKIIHSPEARRNMSLAQMGHPVSREARIKQSRTMTGRKMPEVTRAALRSANTGSHRSPEARERMSAWQRGVPKPESFREMRRTVMTGTHRSKETREKMRESQKARWARLKVIGGSHSNLGTGRGWTFVKGAKRPYQVMCGKQRVGAFATQHDAEQAYKTACEKRKTMQALKHEVLSTLKAFGHSCGFNTFQSCAGNAS